jgi:hypothetical protein
LRVSVYEIENRLPAPANDFGLADHFNSYQVFALFTGKDKV